MIEGILERGWITPKIGVFDANSMVSGPTNLPSADVLACRPASGDVTSWRRERQRPPAPLGSEQGIAAAVLSLQSIHRDIGACAPLLGDDLPVAALNDVPIPGRRAPHSDIGLPIAVVISRDRYIR